MSYLLIIFLSVVGLVAPLDVCHAPFTDYLQCAIGNAEQELDSLILEATPAHEKQINYCFNRYNCDKPDFNTRDPVALFLSGEWKTRVDTLLKFIDNLPTTRTFRQCMVQRFKPYVADVVEKCVHKYGPQSVSDYEIGEIPGFEDVKISDLRKLFEVRMLTRHSLLQCYGCSSGSVNKVENTYKCLEERRDRGVSLCDQRDDCIRKKLTFATPSALRGTPFDNCEQRYDVIRDAGCDCGSAELESGGLGVLTRSPRLKRALIKFFYSDFKACGAFRCSGCFSSSDFKKMRSDITMAVFKLVDFSSGKVELTIPDEIKYAFNIAKSLVGEVITKYTDVICGNCESDKEPKVLNIKEFAEETGRCGAPKPSRRQESEESAGSDGSDEAWDDW